MKHESEFTGGATEYNQSIINARLGIEVHNSFWNHHRIVELLGSGDAEDLKALAKTGARRPVLLLGSGPSLDPALPILRHWRGDIICSQSQAATCVAYGKPPTFIVALDAEAGWGHLHAPAHSWDKTALITHPGAGRSLFDFWPSDFYLFRCSSPNIPFYDIEQADGYSVREDAHTFRAMIDQRIGSFASSVGAQAAIADLLQYRPIFMVGCDFGYPGGKPRFTERRWTGQTWEDVVGKNLESPPFVADNGCPTDATQLHSKRGLVMAWRLDHSPLINCSPDGALGDLFPTADIGSVIAKQGFGFKPLTWKDVELRADRYLAKRGFYVVEADHGVIFLEAASFAVYEEKLRKLASRGAPISIDANLRRTRRAIAA